jgi:hypothetical protein
MTVLAVAVKNIRDAVDNSSFVLVIVMKRVGLIPRSLLRDFIKVAGC